MTFLLFSYALIGSPADGDGKVEMPACLSVSFFVDYKFVSGVPCAPLSLLLMYLPGRVYRDCL